MMWLSSGQWDISKSDNVHFLRGSTFFWAPNYFFLAEMWMWLLQLGQYNGSKMVESQDRRSHASLRLFLDFFSMREPHTSILFPSLLFWISSLPTFQSLVAFIPMQLNTYNCDPIYVEKKSRETYICVQMVDFWLWHRNPQGKLLQQWRTIILCNSKSRGGIAL